jgi:ligand-binding SRPBCC domain-containing protein
MASTNLAPEDFICPLTLEVMKEPVMTRLGHNFELSALLQWLERHDECPLTRNPLTLKDIIVNRALQERIEFWRKQHNGQEDESTEFDKKLPLVVLVKSSKTVIRILEETESPLGKSILRVFRRDRRAMKQRKRRAPAA